MVVSAGRDDSTVRCAAINRCFIPDITHPTNPIIHRVRNARFNLQPGTVQLDCTKGIEGVQWTRAEERRVGGSIRTIKKKMFFFFFFLIFFKIWRR